MNLNEMAKKLTLAEGLKKSINIGQVKEMMKLLFQRLAKMDIKDVEKVLKRYKK